MSITFGIISGGYILGSIIMIVSMLAAPEGHEDETGFHLVWANNNPSFKDVACVWS